MLGRIYGSLLALLSGVITPQAQAEEAKISTPTAHQFSFEMMDGETVNLSDHKGKPILVVNTASQCGFTPQYKGLQNLHETYGDKGLLVLAVPSDNFGGQEFEEEEEVKDFTQKTFALTFPLASISQITGDDAHPFYQWARNEAGFIGSPKWNFHKYLIGPDGRLVEWYSSATKPDSDKIVQAIEKQLATPESK